MKFGELSSRETINVELFKILSVYEKICARGLFNGLCRRVKIYLETNLATPQDCKGSFY